MTSMPLDIVDSAVWITGEHHSVGWSYAINLDYCAFTVKEPEKHPTTVSYWPDPNFNVEEVSNAYDQLEPLTLDLEGWGPPSWDSLTGSQHMSVELVKTIVSDHKKPLAIPDLISEL
ncbi:hypothetical protein FRC10_002619, partial [Ceratobasidium sp. 414]